MKRAYTYLYIKKYLMNNQATIYLNYKIEKIYKYCNLSIKNVDWHFPIM